VGRRWWVFALVAASVIVIAGATIARYHHALAVFLNAGQPTGCGGG
jgi:hypothetical protein